MQISTRLAIMTSAISLALLPNAPAHAISKVAASGTTIQLFQVSSTNPDCSSAGRPVVRITQMPEHGRVSVHNAQVFPLFGPNNPRSACNRRRVQGVQVQYTSQRGYTGYDAVAVDVFFPTGVSRQASYDITVR